LLTDTPLGALCPECVAEEYVASSRRVARAVKRVARAVRSSRAGHRSPSPSMLTVAEAAARLSVSKESVYRLVRRGHLRARKVGAALRIFSESLVAYLGRG
jgi:excisionase family DNA binding protein